MKVLDVNILLYAVNRDSPNHTRAKAWLESVFSADETIAIPWIVTLGFLRIVTNPRILPKPLTVNQATAIVNEWLARPQILLVNPAEHHWRVLQTLLNVSGTAGNLTTDAHLAALAMEQDAELWSSDSDFARFVGLKWMNPLAGN